MTDGLPYIAYLLAEGAIPVWRIVLKNKELKIAKGMRTDPSQTDRGDP